MCQSSPWTDRPPTGSGMYICACWEEADGCFLIDRLDMVIRTTGGFWQGKGIRERANRLWRRVEIDAPALPNARIVEEINEWLGQHPKE